MDWSKDNQLTSMVLPYLCNNLIRETNLDDTSFNLKFITRLLDTGFDINQKFPASSEAKVSGGTILHFVYLKNFSIEVFNFLVEHNADFTARNSKGQTVLHLMMHEWHHDSSEKAETERFINSVLSAHVKSQNISNPKDSNGFSHFHGACIVNHIEAVRFFLENGISADETVNMISDRFYGYTVLHSAVKYACIETIRQLLNYKANVLIEDEKGRTTLFMLIEHSKEVQDIEGIQEYGSLDSLGFLDSDRMIILFLEKDYPLNVTLSDFHAACTMEDLFWVERLLEYVPDINGSISMDSLKWPGYTALHFAAHCNIEIVEFLLEEGANMMAEDAHGLTPLNICLQRYNKGEVRSLSSIGQTWNILLSDGRTRLLDLLTSMDDVVKFRSFLNNNRVDVNAVILIDSPFWPGYTCLHLAILVLSYSSEQNYDDIVRECLNRGSDVNMKNARGETPIYLALRLKQSISAMLQHLESLPEVVDVLHEDDLSHLHLACAENRERLVDRLLATSNVNIVYKGKRLGDHVETGSTPLHVAVRQSEGSIIKMLLDRGADIHAKDVYGMTPVHWIFSDKCAATILFTCADLTNSVTDFGLTYLHVAIIANNKEAVERLINSGSDISAVINYDEHSLSQRPPSRFQEFSGLSPLEIALKNRSYNAFVGLLKNGFRMSTDDFKCTKQLENIVLLNCFTHALKNNDDLCNLVEQEMGLTRLHIACLNKFEDEVRMLLDRGADVHAQIHAKSKFYPECTPIHLLVNLALERFSCGRFQFITTMIKMLVERGADVTVDIKGNTPVNLSLELTKNSTWSFDQAEECMTLLVSAQHDFSANPTSANGVSHFHVACLIHHGEAVEAFLQHGVDVNQPISLNHEKYAMCTPLHLAFKYPLTKFLRNQSPSNVVNLLLKYGANVNAKDIYGNTPLHEACRDARASIDILANLINLGADVRKENARGETPLEILLSSPDFLTEQIELFIKRGSCFNGSNRLSEKGYIGVFMSAKKALSSQDLVYQISQFSNGVTKDEFDRTPIHNTVAITNCLTFTTYIEIINFFVKQGFDIDHADKSGKTPLHYAAQFGNAHAVYALLELGVDINVVDKSGKSAFSYAFQRGWERNNVSDMFFMEVRAKKFVGLEVSRLNQILIDQLQQQTLSAIYSKGMEWYQQEIQRLKGVRIESTSVTLYDFLSDVKVVTNYVFMTEKERDQIGKFFQSIFNSRNGYPEREILTLIKSQYNKAVARMSLIEDALHSLRSLLGFSFAGLCEDISMYLSNVDLKNLIKAAN